MRTGSGITPGSKVDGHDGKINPFSIFQRGRWTHLAKRIGPGLIAGASDDDPSAIGTYAVIGAGFGYTTLWTAIATLPMMVVVQYVCAKIGLVTHQGLGSILRKHYFRPFAYIVVIGVFAANIVTAGIDIGAMADSVHRLLGVSPLVITILIGALILGFQLLGSYRLLTNFARWLVLALLAYVAAAIFARPDWGAVLRNTFIPTIQFNPGFLAALVAVLGQGLTPFMFFWQTDEEVEEIRTRHLNRRLGQPSGVRTELTFAFWDINLGMLVNNVVMYFIILATATALYQHGNTHIDSASEAAEALRPIAGNAAGILFAIGLLGAGFLAVPIILTSSAYSMSQVLGWRYGLNYKPHQARNFYALLTVAVLLAISINFAHLNPIDALYWVSIADGLLAPLLLALIMIVAGNAKIMGAQVNTRLVSVLGWGTTIIMVVVAGTLLVLQFMAH